MTERNGPDAPKDGASLFALVGEREYKNAVVLYMVRQGFTADEIGAWLMGFSRSTEEGERRRKMRNGATPTEEACWVIPLPR
jgi:hypothetical protein